MFVELILLIVAVRVHSRCQFSTRIEREPGARQIKLLVAMMRPPSAILRRAVKDIVSS